MRIKESHLLLYGSEDARVASMQTHYEETTVSKRLHQFALFLQSHRSTASYHSTVFCAKRQLAWHEAASIENEVGSLQKSSATHRYEVRITRTCADNLYVTTTLKGGFRGYCQSPLCAFLLSKQQRLRAGTNHCSRFAYALGAHMAFDHSAWSRYILRV